MRFDIDFTYRSKAVFLAVVDLRPSYPAFLSILKHYFSNPYVETV